MSNVKLKKVVLCALYSAFALISFYIESLFPPLIIPGAKMGISNVFILLSVLTLGPAYGYFCLLIKVCLGSVFVGNISAIMYSLPAGAIALTVEILIFYIAKRVSIISTSVAGAVISITVQNIVFCLIAGTMAYLSYLPYLALIGVLGGAVTGLAVYLAIKRLPRLINTN